MAEINPTATSGTYLNSPKSAAAMGAVSESAANFWGDDGFSFGDFLDLINPLQHLPVIGTLYRAATGDEISNGSSILGGGLFGGIVGAGVAVANTVIEEVTGGEVTDHIMALFEDEPSGDEAPQTTVLASAGNRYGSADAFSRRAQEATWIDTAAEEPVETAAARPANSERPYASNHTFGRRDQEATMTTLASTIAGATAPAPLQAAPAVAELPVTDPAVQAVAMQDPQKASLAASRAPVWLAATPRAEAGFTDTAMGYMTPVAGLQLVQAMPLDAIDRYNLRAAKSMAAGPASIDNLY